MSSEVGSAVTVGAHLPVGSVPRSSVVRTPLRSTFSDFDQGFASDRTETLTVGPELSTYTRTSPGSSAPEPTGSSGRLTWTLPLPPPSSEKTVRRSATAPTPATSTRTRAISQVRLFLSM